MDGLIPKVRFAVKRRILKNSRKCRDAKLKVRYLVIVNLLNRRSPAETARALGIAPSTVYRVARRFRDAGEVGLLDRREDNGQMKLQEFYLATLYDVVNTNPQEHGWRRPTWTREMLVETMWKYTEIRVHVGTMSRALRAIGARRARPRPRVGCPWSKRAKNKRIRQIREMLKNLPPGHVAVYADEVDIHLNPKIGLDWMLRGQQKEVMTPGQNVKRYLAGAMDAETRELIWVEGERKNSTLFVALLQKLRAAYAGAKVIHVVLDNYRIHSSRITRQAVEALDGKIVLHFLPPYCPDENRIEREWEDLHANVTRNHRCPDMESLMVEVIAYLRRRNRRRNKHALRKAA